MAQRGEPLPAFQLPSGYPHFPETSPHAWPMPGQQNHTPQTDHTGQDDGRWEGVREILEGGRRMWLPAGSAGHSGLASTSGGGVAEREVLWPQMFPFPRALRRSEDFATATPPPGSDLGQNGQQVHSSVCFPRRFCRQKGSAITNLGQ